MKKGQAAMEFVMTYGWAILVVLLVIAMLAYFGLLSPDKFKPNRCDCIYTEYPTSIMATARQHNTTYYECQKINRYVDFNIKKIRLNMTSKLFYCANNLTLVEV